MAEEPDVERALRRLADRLDAESRPTSVETVMASPQPRGTQRWRPLMVAAGALATAVTGLILVFVQGDDENLTAADEETTSTTSTTTTSAPSTPGRWSGPAFDSLPAGGFALVEDDTAVLYGYDGAEVGTVDGGADDAVVAPRRQLIVLRPDHTIDIAEPDTGASPDGCDGASDGATPVALCGGDEQLRERVALVAPDGSDTTLIEAAPGSQDPHGRAAGHWRWAIPSPSGSWVLAQWSGECEAPTAFFVATDGPDVRTVDGAPDLIAGAASTGIGWTPDGRAIVEFGPGHCSNGIDRPGIYLVDPDSGDRELLVELERDTPTSPILWSRSR